MYIYQLHSDSDGYFLGNYLWDLLIRRICMDYQKLTRDEDPANLTHTQKYIM